MFVKKSWFTNKNGQRYMTYEIAIAYRDKKTKKVRHKVLSNITHLGEPLISKIEALLKAKDSGIVCDLGSFYTVFGLNEKKLPVYFEIIEGNISDKATVQGLIKGL